MYLKNGRRVRVDLNIGPLMAKVAHGRHAKDMVVLHETVSPDYQGLTDVLGVSRFLVSEGLGIHGVVDGEGNLAWDVYGDTHVLYHTASGAGGVNTRAVGIEQVSNVMVQEKRYPTNLLRWRWWRSRNAQLDKVAKVLAYLHRTHAIPLVYSPGDRPGVTTHWSVTKTFNIVGGHVDCWPRHLGGYYPVRYVIDRAKQFYARGY